MSTHHMSSRGRRIVASVAITAAVCATLSACGSSNQGENTQGASSSSPAVSAPVPDASVSASRKAGFFYRDSKVCVVNSAAHSVTVTFTKKDGGNGPGVLPPNSSQTDEACAYGSSVGSSDVTGTIATTTPDSAITFRAVNPSIHIPYFGGGPLVNQKVNECFRWGYNIDDADATWDNGVLKYTVIRQTDTKEFIRWRVDIADSQKPSEDGIARITCKTQ